MDQRIGRAEEIYVNHIKRADSAYAFSELNNLISLSNKINDPALESAAWSMLADRLARIHGFNATSTQHHRKAIATAKSYNQVIALGIAEFKMGRYCYTFKNYPLAFEHLLRANNIFVETGYSSVPASLDPIYIMGSIYYETGDYDKAEYYFNERIKQGNALNPDKIHSYNNIASIAIEQRDYKKALKNMQYVLDIAGKKPDSVWQGIASGAIGNIYFLQHQYNNAIPFLEMGYQANSTNQIWDQANNNVLRLATIHLADNNIAAAEKCLRLSQDYLQKINFTSYGENVILKSKEAHYEFLSAYYEKRGNTAASLNSIKHLQLIKDSLARQKDIQAFNNIRLRIETEQHLNQVSKLEEDAKTSVLKRNAAIAILALLLISGLLVYNRQRLKIKTDRQLAARRQELLASEKMRAEEELKFAQQQLGDFTENLSQKNELIENFKNELNQIHAAFPAATDRERIEHFDKLVQSTILTNDAWDEFQRLFDKVHKGFIFRLKEKFTNLTENDMRLLCLVKLQLSRREMANMLGVSQEAIKKSKQRLRKKLFGDDPGDIEDLIVTV